MNPMTMIEFDVIPTAPNLPMGLVVQLNNTVIWQKEAVTEQCHVVVPVDDAIEGQHTLQWIVSGKMQHYTVVDEHGTITQDSMLHIDNLKVDGIEFTQVLTTVATYTHDCNGNGPMQTDIMYQDLGCNGVGELQFRTPLYLWLLENM